MSGLDGLGWPDGRDLHAEAEDRELIAEHEAHPERFRRLGGTPNAAAVPVYDGPQGPVGMPDPRGASADGTLGETEEEHLQRRRDAITHNERFFASQNEKSPSVDAKEKPMP